MGRKTVFGFVYALESSIGDFVCKGSQEKDDLVSELKRAGYKVYEVKKIVFDP